MIELRYAYIYELVLLPHNYSHAAKPQACLQKSVTLWLQRSNLIDKAQPPTWRGIIYAVGHSVGGNNMALAERISQNHQCDMQSDYILVTSNSYIMNHVSLPLKMSLIYSISCTHSIIIKFQGLPLYLLQRLY